jgi:hypothetical protein
MRAEAGTRLDLVVIQHAQLAELYPLLHGNRRD